MVQRCGVDGMATERSQVKQQLIELSEDAEDPGLQPGQVGPVEFIEMNVALRLAVLPIPLSHQSHGIVRVLWLFSFIGTQLSTGELIPNLVVQRAVG